MAGERGLEIWKSISGYEGYYSISNHGQIMAHKSFGKYKSGRILVGGINNLGYKIFVLCKDCLRRTHSLHKLVMETFIGESNGKMVNHIDGNKNNNNFDNLEYVTHQENMKHASKIGLVAKGEKTGCAKLTDAEIRRIRKDYCPVYKSYNTLAKEHGVSKKLIVEIVKNRIWKHVEV